MVNVINVYICLECFLIWYYCCILEKNRKEEIIWVYINYIGLLWICYRGDFLVWGGIYFYGERSLFFFIIMNIKLYVNILIIVFVV